ncbi:MAG: hypothetical protein Q4P18_07875 [Methanobrevibacter sp.]|uniref:hypothetical protein n=1 Tax=Methanobrevibacter sp. TaxID=66852 RepID=UPI0026DF5FC1|nr:hypothetical protein [Methanobrevibacter sp.]MDO5849438.1 hypothetical protein [Methanobrevibacter sp.]
MSLEIKELEKEDIEQFKNDIQHAFQKGATDFYGKIDVEILPESHIDQSLNDERSHAYKAVLDGELVGGAIVLIDENTQHNHLDFLYVNSNASGKTRF